MNKTDDFTHVQRRLSEVIAKSEWTSSRMRMQKTGDELRERRAKKHRTNNQFLQELLEKRIDSDLIDDHGTVDRYRRFLKYKSSWNDGDNSIDELDRRLSGLNRKRSENSTRFDQSSFDSTLDTTYHQDANAFSPEFLPSFHESQHDLTLLSPSIEPQFKTTRLLPSINPAPVTSTPNDTADESLDQTSQDEGESMEKSVSDLSELVKTRYFPDVRASLGFEQIQSIPSSNSNNSLFATLVRPTARRPDGSEVQPVISSQNQSPRTCSSKVLPWQYSTFPRSLLTRKTDKTVDSSTKRQLPSIHQSEVNSSPIEQFDKSQIFHLLDNLDVDSNSSTSENFTTVLDQLKTSTVIHCHSLMSPDHSSTENLTTSIHEENNHEEILHHPFDKPSSIHERAFFTKLTVSVTDPATISLYTMTVGTVQLSASISLPYSILNGRRPFLKSSKKTNFKPIRSKGNKYTCHVTAIESTSPQNSLQPNDIVLEINDQSILKLTTDDAIELIKQNIKRFNTCSLTIARLCRPSFEFSST